MILLKKLSNSLLCATIGKEVNSMGSKGFTLLILVLNSAADWPLFSSFAPFFSVAKGDNLVAASFVYVNQS